MRRLLLTVCAILLPLSAVAAKPPPGLGSPLRNTGLESAGLLWGAGNLMGFLTREGGQGDTDLDGNGDTAGTIFFVYDGDRNRVVNTRLDFGSGGAISFAEPGVVYLTAREWSLGRDVNQDGDLWDPVAHVYDQRSGRVLNTDWVGTGGYNWRRKVFLPASGASDNAQIFDLDSGERADLGFDFQWLEVVRDDVLLSTSGSPYRYDPDTGALIPLGLEAGCDAPLDAGDVAVFLCREESGPDLNGDGDLFDRVPVVYEAGSGAVTVLEFAVARTDLPSWGILASDGWAVVVVSEAGSGATDLNADGDLEDEILFSVRLGPGSFEITNTGEAVDDRIFQRGPLSLFRRAEGTSDSGFYGGFDAERGEVIDLGGHNSTIFLTSEFIGLTRHEFYFGDLNGDGDTLDRVVHYYDPSRRSIINTRLGRFQSVRAAGEWLAVETKDCRPPSLAGAGGRCVTLVNTRTQRRLVHRLPTWHEMYLSETIFAVQTPERSGSFQMDLNGDGDPLDGVLFLMELHGPGPPKGSARH